MSFNSLSFLGFLLVVYGLFWMMPNWYQKKLLLLMASYLFYAAWNPPYIFILLLSTAVDWYLARCIGRTENLSKRRMLFFLSLACNLGLLSYFKYGGFLLENFTLWMAALGFAYHVPKLDILLPIGVSFYTFASLSYTIDVYRKHIRPDARLIDYALFVSFFPHLIAGPIVRASYLIPQIQNPQLPSKNQVGWGFALVCFGLFSKIVMADTIFAPTVDAVFNKSTPSGFFDTWLAVFSFSGQIYYDFSGYSLCAIGLAMSFGFWFPNNFHRPYAASSFSDFWRRWHITLSTWLRDYLYISLGGNRHGEQRTYCNLMITMLIGGLWHGASWMFVLWGGLHGLYLVIEKASANFYWPRIFSIQGKSLLIFVIVSLTWIPFRAESPKQAIMLIRGLFNMGPIPYLDLQGFDLDLRSFIVLVAMMGTVRWQFLMKDKSIEQVVSSLGQIKQTALISTSLIGLFLCSSGNQNAFIYFQF